MTYKCAMCGWRFKRATSACWWCRERLDAMSDTTTSTTSSTILDTHQIKGASELKNPKRNDDIQLHYDRGLRGKKCQVVDKTAEKVMLPSHGDQALAVVELLGLTVEPKMAAAIGSTVTTSNDRVGYATLSPMSISPDVPRNGGSQQWSSYHSWGNAYSGRIWNAPAPETAVHEGNGAICLWTPDWSGLVTSVASGDSVSLPVFGTLPLDNMGSSRSSSPSDASSAFGQHHIVAVQTWLCTGNTEAFPLSARAHSEMLRKAMPGTYED